MPRSGLLANRHCGPDPQSTERGESCRVEPGMTERTAQVACVISRFLGLAPPYLSTAEPLVPRKQGRSAW